MSREMRLWTLAILSEFYSWRGDLSPIERDDRYPIRRLIITGLDTPRNLRVFFGPRFQMVGRVLRGERISVLLDEVHVYSRRWDHGYPYFAPRPASAAEAKFVPQLREYREYETKGVYDDSDDYTSEDENHPDEGEKFSVTMRMGRMKRRRLGNSILF
jgi:hypothetical protein